MATMYTKDILWHVFVYDDTTKDIVKGKVLSNKKLQKASPALTVFAVIISWFPSIALYYSPIAFAFLTKYLCGIGVPEPTLHAVLT